MGLLLPAEFPSPPVVFPARVHDSCLLLVACAWPRHHCSWVALFIHFRFTAGGANERKEVELNFARARLEGSCLVLA